MQIYVQFELYNLLAVTCVMLVCYRLFGTLRAMRYIDIDTSEHVDHNPNKKIANLTL